MQMTTKLKEAMAYAIAVKWVKVLGGGYHPDNSGADYVPPLTAAQAAEYDADMDQLFKLAEDPYIYPADFDGMAGD